MGLIYTQINLSNPSRNDLSPLDLKALVDFGSMFLCVPAHVALQFKLRELHTREVTFANNFKQLCLYVGPVYVKYGNRECMTGALVTGEQVLLGAIPMEDMDLKIDMQARKLVVNPASPNIPSAVVM